MGKKVLIDIELFEDLFELVTMLSTADRVNAADFAEFKQLQSRMGAKFNAMSEHMFYTERRKNREGH